MNVLARIRALEAPPESPDPCWLAAVKQAALDRLTAWDPAETEEEWRFVSARPYLEPPSDKSLLPPPSLQAPPESLENTLTLDFEDGRWLELLPQPLPDGLRIRRLKQAIQQDPEGLSDLMDLEDPDSRHALSDLVLLLAEDGLLIEVAKDTVLSQPIRLLYRRRAEGHFSAVHHILRLAEGAEATVIETHTGPDDLPYVATSLTRVDLAAGARLDHYKQQNEGNGGRHFGGLYVHQAPKSVLHQTHLALGSQFARTEIHSLLEEGSECYLEGSFVALNRAVVDTHTRLRHRGRAALSREHYRGIATANGQGIFQGRIIVEPGAQKTEAFMHSKNLLLSDQAEIDAKPQLEIEADDVRCAHGVSIGQIEPNQIFYLRSRGLDEAEALRVLTQGFVATVLTPVRPKALRAQMESDLHKAVERAIDGRDIP